MSVCTECSETIMPLGQDCDKCKCWGCLYRSDCTGFTACKICSNANECNGEGECGDCKKMVSYIVRVIEELGSN